MAISEEILKKRAEKRAKAAALNAKFFAEQRAKLEEHLRIAKEAAEGGRPQLKAKVEVEERKAEASSLQPGTSTSTPAPAPAPAAPKIRMAPGWKPKAPTVVQPQSLASMTSHKGFKPLQKAPVAAPTISISVAAAPKPKVKPVVKVDDYDDDRGNKGKRGRELAKSFDKRPPRVAQVVPQQGSRISVDEANKEISIRGAVVVKDFAAKLNIKPNRLIADLMGLKILASINQRIEPDVATKIAEKYGFKVVIEHARDKAAAKPVMKAIDADDLIPEDAPETLRPRAPVITFMGHVDHGKTTLMDWIRKEKVAAGEAGGITQQISAYQVDVAGRKITFLDTPGHAAFSAMRARGAQITDIAVLIIAADDGIMPQTEECIKVTRQTGVQVMVAITKADKPTANIDRVKQQLQKAGLTPEDWGGDIICCPVSGKTGEGVDALLENILVQAEVLELQANPARRANGFVIESELQQGLGPCATVLVTGGTLKVGDAILIGEHFGKVRALIDDRGRRIKEAPPSTPVKVTGLSGVPEAGSEFRVMLDEKRARELAEQTAQEKKEEALASNRASSLDALMSRMAAEGQLELNVIVKSENQGHARGDRLRARRDQEREGLAQRHRTGHRQRLAHRRQERRGRQGRHRRLRHRQRQRRPAAGPSRRREDQLLPHHLRAHRPRQELHARPAAARIQGGCPRSRRDQGHLRHRQARQDRRLPDARRQARRQGEVPHPPQEGAGVGRQGPDAAPLQGRGQGGHRPAGMRRVLRGVRRLRGRRHDRVLFDGGTAALALSERERKVKSEELWRSTGLNGSIRC